MKRQPYRKFSKEFKTEAVRLAEESDKPVTQKPAETRMGKGKGAPEYWVAVVKPGRIMFEI